MRPLDGIFLLDLTRLLPGAVASHILATFGAEVVKVEQPGSGDYARFMPPLLDGQGAVFSLVNRGKKSLALDLKHPQGKHAFLDLVPRADVVLEGFRPGVMDRLGLGYAVLSSLNPRLIYAALTGYGQTGPNIHRAGHDINYLASSGALDQFGAVPGIQIADLAAGSLQTVIGILLALEARHRTGLGQMVDVSMVDGLAPLMAVPLALLNASGSTPKLGATTLTGRYACYNLYRARDGRSLALGALEPKFWAVFCEAMSLPHFIPDQFAAADRQRQMIDEIGAQFATRDAHDWVERFGPTDACVSLVLELSEAIDDKQFVDRETVTSDGEHHLLGVVPRLSRNPGRPGSPPPALGEHNAEFHLPTPDSPPVSP